MIDARTARAYAAARDKVDAGRLVYFGESLGAAVAVALALASSASAAMLITGKKTSPGPAVESTES